MWWCARKEYVGNNVIVWKSDKGRKDISIRLRARVKGFWS